MTQNLQTTQMGRESGVVRTVKTALRAMFTASSAKRTRVGNDVPFDAELHQVPPFSTLFVRPF
jgi:hypothetical protein